MAVIKCKMCGGDLVLIEGQSVAECEYCGSRQTVPAADNEKKLTLFARANRLRAACEFDKAAGIYETIVADFPEEAESYWGLVLCKYGIEYVDDPGTGKKIPTCHRSSFESILEDSDLEQALENADYAARRIYREEAKQIEQLRRGIIAVSANEQPYDIFICYKETDENGNRTLDSVLAQDIYDALTEKGYRVFFSRITLEDKLGVEYEPYIFAALHSARIMLAVGTDYEFYNAVWVKNEWSRYLKLMTQDKNKHLIPCYKGIDAYDMPREFAKLQAQDLGKMGAIQDILRGVEKLLPRNPDIRKEPAAAEPQAEVSATQPLLRRAFLFLEDGEWEKADEYCEKVLDMNPECAEAYLGKLLSELRVHKKGELSDCTASFAGKNNYQKALRFADPVLRAELEQSLAVVTAILEVEKNAVIENGVLKQYTGNQSRVVIPKHIKTIAKAAFEGCRSMTSVELPDSVTEIASGAFARCENLAAIRVSAQNQNFRSVGTCLIDRRTKTVLSAIRFGDIPTDGSIRCIGAYACCHNGFLTDLQIPEGVAEIGEYAFWGCSNLNTVELPDSITAIAATAIPHNPGIRIRVDADHPVFRMAGSCLIHKTEKTVVFGTDVRDLPTDGSVEKIGAYAFFRCEVPESIVLPECMHQICDHAFAECNNLKSVTFYGKNIDIADSALGPEAQKLTVFAFEDSDAARWAKKNRIPTRENEKMKRISTAALLARGNQALKIGEWSQAAGFFEGVLRNDPRNAQAYLGKTLVQEQCRSLDTLVRQRSGLYRNVRTEKLYIQEDLDHIREMAEKYSIPGYVDGNEIRKLYVFDRSYSSEVSGRKQQYLEEKSWWQNNRQLSSAAEFAEEDLAEQIQVRKKEIFSQLSNQVRIAQEADAGSAARVKAAYDAHIAEADKEAERIYQEGFARREQDYQDWQKQAEQETDPKRLKNLAEKFTALEDYQDSRTLAEACRRRAAEEQEKIAAEKKRQRAMAAEKKKARRRRFRPILAVIAVITAACILLTGPVSQLLMHQWLPEYGYRRAEKLFAEGQYEEAIAKFEALGDYTDAAVRVSEIRYLQAEELFAEGLYQEAMAAFASLDNFKDSATRAVECELTELASRGIRQAAIAYYKAGNRGRSMELWHSAVLHKTVSAGLYHTVGLKNDGTVLATGQDLDAQQKAVRSGGQTQVQAWRNIISVTAGQYHTVGLKKDGTVVATGLNDSGQCNVSRWTDIVSVAAGDCYTAGLRADGTVVIAGKDVESAGNWRNVIEIAGGRDFLLGLLSDQTTVSTKSSDFGAEEDVISIAAAQYYLCLKKDGSVAGKQIETNGKKLKSVWAGGYIVLGILEDGTAAYKGGIVSEWTPEESEEYNLEQWDALNDNDIAAFAAGIRHAVLLKQDGTVTAFGENAFGGCNVKSWSGIKIPEIPEDTFVLPEDIFTMDVSETVARDDGPAYVEAEKLLAEGEILKAAIAFGKLGDYADSEERSLALWNAARTVETISAGQFRTMAVQNNGTMLSTDSRFRASGITQVSDGSWHYAGLRSNGTVVADVVSEFPDKWQNINRDKGGHSGQCDVDDWRDMVQVSAGDMHTLGLRKNGTVIGAGINDFGRWQTDTWQNIVAVSAGYDHSVGLHADGHVFTVGGNKNGVADTTLWKNIVAVSAGKFFTVGLQMDGTVIASGNNDFGQCDVSAYHDIVAVSAGNTHTVALRLDGTVVAVGGNEYGQCDVSSWRDIVAIDAGGWHTVGLKSDGTMVAAGHTGDRRCDVAGWKGIKLPAVEMQEFPSDWTDGRLPEEYQKPMADLDYEAEYVEAERLLAAGETAKAAIAFGKLGDYEDARERSFELWETITYHEMIPTNWTKQDNLWDKAFVALRNDGTVASAFPPIDEAVSQWTDIVALETSSYPSGSFVIGLKKNGTVVTAIVDDYIELDTSDWKDIVAIDSKDGVAVALKMDGTVVATSKNTYGTMGTGMKNSDQWNVSGWTDVVAVYATGNCTMGLRADGTMLASGTSAEIITGWTDIASISTSGSIVGIKNDGTVVTTGTDSSQHHDLSGWKNIESVDTSSWSGAMVGMKSDGTVITVGMDKRYNGNNVQEWNGIVDVYTTDTYTVALKSDGTVVGCGLNIDGSLNVEKWTDIVAIRVWYDCVVGLKSDGTVVYAGKGHSGMNNWSNIKIPNKTYVPGGAKKNAVDPAADYAEAENLLASGETAKAAIAFGKLGDYEDARQRSMDAWSQCAVRELIATSTHTVGIRSNGTVAAVGANDDGECKVSGWKDIVAVSVSLNHTVGLKADGTVLAVGRNDNGKCDVSDWRDIVDISAGSGHTAGLKSDGTVVAVGWNGCEVSDWQDIADISAGGNHTVGLKSDGTVVATGMNDKGQCNVSDWENIVAVSAGYDNTAGLRADGTVVAVGSNEFGQCNVSGWQDIVSISTGSGSVLGLKSDGTVVVTGRKDQGLDDVWSWEDIAAIDASYYHGVGLKSDGTVVAAGANNWGQSNISGWSDMKLPN